MSFIWFLDYEKLITICELFKNKNANILEANGSNIALPTYNVNISIYENCPMKFLKELFDYEWWFSNVLFNFVCWKRNCW